MSRILFFLIIALTFFLIIKWVYIFFRDYKRIVVIYDNSSPEEDKTLFLIADKIIQKYKRRLFISVIIIILLFTYLFMYYRAEVMEKRSYSNIDYLLPAIIIILITLFVLYIVLNFLRIKPDVFKDKFISSEAKSDKEMSLELSEFENNLPKERILLLELINNEGQELSQQYQWVDEHDRWVELVFTILTQIIPLNHLEIRQITEKLSKESLLNIKELSNINFRNPDELKNLDHFKNFREILNMHKIDETLINDCFITICETAEGISTNFSGKIQKYIRSYGELLLSDIQNNFKFTLLNHDQIRNSFIYWMQNVLNMPISLNEDILVQFAEQNDITVEELYNEADNIDINLAVLDDLVQLNVYKNLKENNRINKK